jgi:hypothetical protein
VPSPPSLRSALTPLFGLLLIATAPACVVDAPETIEELVVFGFQNYDERPAYLEATIEGLLPLLPDVEEELEDGYRVDLLAEEHLEAAGIESPQTEGIVGALGAATYCHDLDPVLDVITDPDKDELFEAVESYEVTSEHDRDCFLAGDCERMDLSIEEVADASLLGMATRSYTASFRWIELEDGRRVIASRTLAPEPVSFTTDFLAVYQQYAFVVLYQDGEHARRLETLWVDADLGELDVPDLFAVQQAVRAMGTQAERICALLDE